MNERQPYEKLIADKLQQLRGPDVNTSWDKMKRLLDDDQQPKGGGGKKRPGGWWRIGIIAIVLTGYLLFYVESNKSSTNNITTVQNNGDNGTAAATPQTDNNNQKKNTTGKTSTLTNAPATSNNDKNETNVTAVTTAGDGGTETGTNANETAGNKSELKTSNNSAGNKVAAAIAKKNIQPVAADNAMASVARTSNSAAGDKKALKDRKLVIAKTNSDKYNSNTGTVNASDALVKIKTGSNKTGNRKITGGPVNDAAIGSAAGTNHALFVSNSITSNNKKDKAGKNRLSKADAVDELVTTGNGISGQVNSKNIPAAGDKAKNTNTPNNNTISGEATNDVAALTGRRAHGSTLDNNVTGAIPATKMYADEWGNLVLPYQYEVANTAGMIDGNIAGSRPTNNLLSKEAKELALKNRFAEVGKKKRSLNINLADVFMPFSLKRDGEPWWAVGLSLNSSLAVAGQSRYNYNVNAKSNTISDYLPSPYVQYHMNDYVYLQTELNLSTPQHVPQLLVSQYNTQNPVSQGTIQTSIYIQKLYYFNWPFSLHYSPVKNLYIAGGLQFSSLQSGIALQEQKELNVPGPGATNKFVYKFKDDTTAARFTPTEWRWETGADYYINRFTLGFRYNKAFKDAIKLNVSSTLPQTINRNTSFMLFMKYNLFEGRNKENAGQPSSIVRY